MKQLFVKKILLMVMTLIIGTQVMARVVIKPRPEGLTKIDTLYYYLDDDKLTAEVTYAGVHVVTQIPVEGTNLSIKGEWIVHDQYISGEVDIPATVTYENKKYVVTKIGSNAFTEQSVTSIIVPRSVTSIGAYAFSSTSSLQNIVFLSEVPPVLEENAFTGNNALATIKVPTESLEAYRNAEGWKNLNIIGIQTKYTVLNGITYGIDVRTSTAYVKSVPTDVTSVDIPASIDYDGVDVPVTAIGDSAFYNCTQMTSVNIPEGITSIGNRAFYAVRSLTSVVLPNSVTSIGDYAFMWCDNLTSITIPDNVTRVGTSAFFLTSWYNNQKDGVVYIGKVAYKYKGTMPENMALVLKEGTTYITPSAFSACGGLTSITIPNSVTSIDNYAFKGCSGLSAVVSEMEDPCTFGDNAFDGISDTCTLRVPDGTKAAHIAKGWTKEVFKGGIIDAAAAPSITFADSVVEALCVANWDTDGDGELDTKEAAAVTSLGTVFVYNKKIISFEELQYFTGLTAISGQAFDGCSGLTSITIPESVTSIGWYAFGDCSGLTSVTIPEGVTSIGDYAFDGCTSLTSPVYNSTLFVHLPTSYEGNYSIPNGIKEICSTAFSACGGLTSITIPNSVTSIGGSAFQGCSGLTSVVSEMENPCTFGNRAFNGISDTCTLRVPDGTKAAHIAKGWTKEVFKGGIIDAAVAPSITFADSVVEALCVANWDTDGDGELDTKEAAAVTSLGTVFMNNKKITSFDELQYFTGLTAISGQAFYGCSGLTSITIPEGVTSIGDYAFFECSDLISVTIPDLANWCNIDFGTYDSNPLYYAHHLFLNGEEVTDLTIPEGVTSVGQSAFYGCRGLTSVTIPESVTSIGDWAFEYCSGLTSVTIPESVTSIGDRVFWGCSNLTSVTIPGDVQLGENAFDKSTAIYTKVGNPNILMLWKAGNTVYDISTKEVIKPVWFTDITQTTAVMNVGMYKGYTYTYNDGIPINSAKTKLTGLKPEWTQVVKLKISMGDVSYTSDGATFETASLAPTLEMSTTTASSIKMDFSYTKGDARVLNPRLVFNIDTIPLTGSSYKALGLIPNYEYDAEYLVDVPYGDGETQTYSSGINWVTTKQLVLTMQQPKVVSAGNAIISATTNIDEDEYCFGFEWRRTDWTEEFASQTAKGYVYGGQMEGYIRDLNTEKLWKVRPFYRRGTEEDELNGYADAMEYYYGDWVGLDPSNTSYFEPTVHTYAKISVEGNSALVRGYALRGTDNVSVQGFKYWKSVAEAKSREEAERRSAVIPADAMTEEVPLSGAGQQQMSASLAGLDYNATYHFVAFVTTSENETFYGEEQTFTTGDDPTGVESIGAEPTTAAPAVEVARYNMNGQRIAAPQKGVNILRMSDGSTRKVLVK